MRHQMHERIGGIIDMQEFAPGGANAPDDELPIVPQFCFMRLAYQAPGSHGSW